MCPKERQFCLDVFVLFCFFWVAFCSFPLVVGFFCCGCVCMGRIESWGIVFVIVDDGKEIKERQRQRE